MAKGPKGFTDIERERLKDRLCSECEKSWAIHGYKKTSITELTSKVGISTGAFYLLYPAKEDLFFETIESIRNRLKSQLKNILTEEKGKLGLIKALKWQFNEYNNFPFLYDFNSPDFLAFVNKLPVEKVELLKFDNTAFFQEAIALAKLKFRFEENKTYNLINAALYTVTLKDKLNYDLFEIFDFILTSIVDDLFEEE